MKKPKPPVRRAKPKPREAETKKTPMRISLTAQLEAAERVNKKSHANVFMRATPAPGVVPAKVKLAMDEGVSAWAGGMAGNFSFQEGYSFLGYPYLAELAQIAEYRLISDVISQEATRKWVLIKSKSEDKGKAEKIAELEAEWRRLGVRDAFEAVSWQDSSFGRSHLYIDTGQGEDRKELMTPLGGPKQELAKGCLKALKTIEPVWTYPQSYNSRDPLADDWYKPTQWFVMGKQMHCSRLLTFVSRPVSDLLKPAFGFGGLALTQMAKPYVDNWLQTRQSVNDLIQAFSTMILATDMGVVLTGGASTDLMSRVDIFNNTRNNRGTMVIDKNSEDLKNVTVPLGTLDKLQAQAQEHICSVSRIPLVKYTGLSPTGLNASSDGEIRAFYDTIHAYQEKFFGRPLDQVFKITQISLWGQVDEDLVLEFYPLWEMDEVQQATVAKTKADTHKVYVDGGVLDPSEVRVAIANDPDQPYGDIDPDEVPEPEPEPDKITEKLTPGEDPAEGEDPDAPPSAPEG